MRYYTHEELKELASVYKKYWLENTPKEDSSSYPELPKTDLNVFLDTNLNKKSPVKFKDFLNIYSLNVRDYFEDEHIVIEDTIKNTSEDKRYPIIVLYTETTGEPNMLVLSEYNTIVKDFESDDLEILVLDKMNYPINEDILQKMADYYKMTYNVSSYQI